MKKEFGMVAIIFFVLTICLGMVMAQEKPAMAQTGFSKMDTNGNGEITAVEHREFWKGRFSELDANKDGKLTVDEFVQGVTKQTFNNADVDKNKVLMAQEYVAYWCGPTAKAPKDIKGKAQANLVAGADINKDGKISTDECLAIWLTHFNNMDTDKNDKVTMDEFVTYIKKSFKELDKNGDGYIVLEEYDYYWSGKGAPVKK
jgi:Ca2+-binding EF-hand superfamily protein